MPLVAAFSWRDAGSMHSDEDDDDDDDDDDDVDVTLSNSCDCTNKRPVQTMTSLPSEAMCLVAMIDCEGWLVSAEDAMNMAEEALDLCLEVQDHR